MPPNLNVTTPPHSPPLFAIRQGDYDPNKHELPMAVPAFDTQEFKRGMVVSIWHDTNNWVFSPMSYGQVGTAYMGLLFEDVDPYKRARVIAKGTIVGDGVSEGGEVLHNPLIWVSEKVQTP